MKAIEVHRLSGEEIETELARLQRRLYELRVQAATEKIENPSMFAKVRRDVARLMTEQRARIIRKSGAAK
jgi:large subunit ribosomal protein L29